jgi:hypothetical protein
MGYWHVFLDDLDPAFEVRLAYLRRHPPAPMSWGDWVYRILHSQAFQREEDVWKRAQMTAQSRGHLLALGLITSDAAYPIWLGKRKEVRWPWTFARSLEVASRHRTREFWFWSRQIAALRGEPGWTPPKVPAEWSACAGPLATGQLPDLDLTRGLLTLAQMFVAGKVLAPWQVGLTPAAFANTFEMDMGYVDAFRLWITSVFDDRDHFNRYLRETEVPENWSDWLAEQVHIAW